jgi:ABC-type transporter Mla subunit MlaD
VNLTEFFVLLIALASITGAAALVRLTRRIDRTAAEVDQLVQVLAPKIDRALEEVRREVGEFRDLTGHLNNVAESFERVTNEVGRTAVPLLRDIEKLRQSKRYLEAAAAGVWRGYRTWRERTTAPNNHSEGVEP